MFESVVIALSHSPLDTKILETAKHLVLPPLAKLILVHVLPVPQTNRDRDVSRPLSEELSNHQIEEYLRQRGQELPGYHLVFEMVEGDAETEILRLAHIYQASLIILGTRGLTGVDRILAGSVSSLVVEQAPCTVLVVKP
ncbi:MAG: universal stress protein [Cyanobacteria bacterium REEB459]|nr:universal stress protein [Cyanobacteria bacterium REEB459]